MVIVARPAAEGKGYEENERKDYDCNCGFTYGFRYGCFLQHKSG